MLAQAGMLLAAGEEANATAPGPTGPPTNVSIFNSGDELDPVNGIQWTNGDVTATSQTGFSTNETTEPTGVWLTSSAGVTSQDTTNNTCGRYWWVRHAKNSKFSVWVLGGQGVFCVP